MLAAFVFFKSTTSFSYWRLKVVVRHYPCKLRLFGERQSLREITRLPPCAVWNAITFKHFPHMRCFAQVWASQRALSSSCSKRFANWNTAADIEPKSMFQIVVVSKTRVPSVDDELRINHLGPNKISFAWNWLLPQKFVLRFIQVWTEMQKFLFACSPWTPPLK